MKLKISVLLLAIVLSSRSQADLFDSMLDTIKDTAVITATTLVTAKATELIINMIIDYSTEQTKTDEQVSKEYEEENGSLPATTTVSSYQTMIMPGASVTPGTPVSVKSTIAVVPGKDGAAARLEESLTIYDSEDTGQVLKSMTKPAGLNTGGEFNTAFSFTLPEGMPQGVYPIQNTLKLNGVLVGDNAHELQLVLRMDDAAGTEMVALLQPRIR